MRALLLSLLLVTLLGGTAVAAPRENPADDARPPADRGLGLRPGDPLLPKPRPGVARLQAWLEANVRGAFWGSYRCEKWGKHEASLHAENRAIDWHLDATRSADRKEAQRLIDLLLAADSAGNQQALARRMGVEELIWDCGYWAAGMTGFQPYRPCFGKRGRPKRHMNVTVAHRDHVHIGMTRAGAKAKTSFWRRHTG